MYVLIDITRDHGNRCELLLAQYALHIALQCAVDIERDHPDAEHKDGQREQGHPGFNGVQLKEFMGHSEHLGPTALARSHLSL